MENILSLPDFLSSERINFPFAVVCGNPISHSLSPMVHNFAYQRVGLNVTYYAVKVAQADEMLLPKLFRHENFCGANITIPLKQQILAYLDIPSDDVLQSGACNTVYRNNSGQICGQNTDISGFIAPLRPYLDQIRQGRVLVFGSGGASKAVVQGLKNIGIGQISIVSRDPATALSPGVTMLSYSEWPAAALQATLIINTTPLGMFPNVSGSPVEDDFVPVLAKRICYDIIYTPRITRFLHQAASVEAHIIDGLDMFVGQASGAFSLFTGHPFPDVQVKELLVAHFDAQKH